jgi:hypothetical protein
MKKLSRYFLFWLFVFCSVSQQLKAQETVSLKEALIADSLSSANTKDVLSNFFQLALNNLMGEQREFKFTGNLFAIMLKRNPDLKVDTNYVRYKAARNLNMDLNAKLDSGNKFNGFSIGLKYAIINKRDVTTSRVFLEEVNKRVQINKAIFKDVAKAISAKYSENDSLKILLSLELNDFSNKNGELKFSQLNPLLRELLNNETQKYSEIVSGKLPDFSKKSIGQMNEEFFRNHIKDYQNKPLLTSSFDLVSYTDEFRLSNVNFTLDYLMGTSNHQRITDVEIIAKASMGFGDDSTKADRDLSRSIFSGEAGINWVINAWGNEMSLLEFKAALFAYSVLSGKYNGEDSDKFTLNGTIRFRISNEITIPIEFKYDPKTANVFGFLSITSNFNWLGRSNN